MTIKVHNKLSIRVILSSLIVYVIGVLITIVIAMILSTLTLFFRNPSPKLITKFVVAWGSLNLGVLKFLCGLNYQVYGQDNLSKALKLGKGFVVASNHQSAWDIPACVVIFKQITFLTKASVLRIPFLGWGLAMLKPVAINRKKKTSAMRALLEQGAARLQEKYIFIAFPEGSRQPMHTIGKYNMGASLLATKTGSIILPMVHNAGSYWARKSPWRFAGTIQTVIGEPIDSTAYDPRELTEQLEQWSRKQLALIEQGKPNPHLKLASSSLKEPL